MLDPLMFWMTPEERAAYLAHRLALQQIHRAIEQTASAIRTGWRAQEAGTATGSLRTTLQQHYDTYDRLYADLRRVRAAIASMEETALARMTARTAAPPGGMVNRYEPR